MVANERSIFRNTAFSVAGRGAGDLFAFLFLIVFARRFGSDALGEFSFAMAVGAVAAMLVVPGMNSLMVREIARNPDQGPRLVGAMAALQLAIGVALFALLLLVAGELAEGARAREILIIVGLYQLLYTLGMVFRHYFRAREQMQYSAALEAGHKALILVLGLLAVLAGQRAETALLAYPLAGAAMYAAGFTLLARRHAVPRLHFDLGLSRRWFTASLPLFAISVIGVVQARSGIIWLGSVGDADSVGLFAASDRMIAAASLLFPMFNAAVYPVMARLSASTEELNQLLARCLRLSLTLAVPMAALIALLREPLVVLVFGSGFKPAADALGILALSMVPAAVSGLGGSLMMACNGLKSMLAIQLAGITAYFIAIAVLVPAQGFTGLAWSVLILKLVTCGGTLMYLHRHGHHVPVWKLLRGPFAASAGMAGAFELAMGLPVALRLVLAAAAGALLLVLFRGVEKHDLAYLRRILGLAT